MRHLRFLNEQQRFFESKGDHLSAWMALDNAAWPQGGCGDIDQAFAFAERATSNWRDEPRNADEKPGLFRVR